MHKKSLFLIFLSLILLASFSYAKKMDKKILTLVNSSGQKIEVKAEMARTSDQQMHGYMNRKNIPAGTGMLFLFSEDRIARFWMKNTPSPLSIAYIDYKGKIRDIFDMTPLSTAEVVSTSYVRYALEVPQGWFEEVGISKGDYLVLDF
ncbi:MAG: DUF192 domain-containing protein [Treponemataceae bacterium]|nr:DUF192 domain-containing protein [Treponemataceae bacterium]